MKIRFTPTLFMAGVGYVPGASLVFQFPLLAVIFDLTPKPRLRTSEA